MCSWIWNCDIKTECRPWIVSIICKKGGDLGRGMGSVVVGEFCDWEKVSPVVLLVVGIHPQVRFEGLIGLLCLSVRLWVLSRVV